MNVTIMPTLLHGAVTPPPSKSQAHRLLLAAALAEGTSTLSNVAFSQDIRATLSCVEALGASWSEKSPGCIRITGLLGITDGSKDPLKVETQLRKVIPPEESNAFCHRMVLHGRAVCVARRPDCRHCTLRQWCDAGTKVTAAE